MKKRIVTLGIMILCVAAVVLSGCDSREQKEKDAAKAAYAAQVKPDAEAYFKELVSSACGAEIDGVTVSFALGGIEFFQSEVKPIEELLKGGDCPTPTIGFNYAGEGEFSEEDISWILHDAVKRELTVDLIFDGKDDTVYKVIPDGVTVDRILGPDGGNYRERYEYDFSIEDAGTYG